MASSISSACLASTLSPSRALREHDKSKPYDTMLPYTITCYIMIYYTIKYRSMLHPDEL